MYYPISFSIKTKKRENKANENSIHIYILVKNILSEKRKILTSDNWHEEINQETFSLQHGQSFAQ